jgi:hypothetical protein
MHKKPQMFTKLISNKIYLVLLCCLLISTDRLYAQLNIKVVDSEKKSVAIAYLRIYNADSTNKLLDYKMIRNGNLSYNPSFRAKQIRLWITSSGYNDYLQVFETKKFQEEKNLLITLQKADKINQLDTVIVIAKRPIVVKEDTTTYQVEAFKDGTERKLQDILKKLPGIEVNEKSGAIKFKGKPIETILLEGDNLFGHNYTVGSKNINADIVKEVQAIENYSDNYVLKGLEREEKVALNIKTNKTKFEISGAGEIGIGVAQANKKLLEANLSLMGLKQSHKFFSVSSFNNTGNNKSPFDFFGNSPSLEQIKERRYLAEKFISDPSFSMFLDETRANFNSQFFTNYNGLFKLSKKTSLKANLYFLNDEINNKQSFDNQYYIDNKTITYQDNILSDKNPKVYKGDLYLRNNTSAKALLEYTSSFSRENINSLKSATSNFIPTYQNNLSTESNFAKNTLVYTQRIGDKNAIQFTLFNTVSNIRQGLVLSPSIFTNNGGLSDRQASNFEKISTFAQGVLYGKNKSGVYNFSVRQSLEVNNFTSSLSNDTKPNRYNQNEVSYTKNSFVQSGNINFQIGKWKIGTRYALTYLNQRLEDKINPKNELTKTNFVFEPNLKTGFVLSKLSNLSASFAVTQKPQTERYLFRQGLTQNYRNVLSNEPSLELLKTQNISFNYFHNDAFNQFDNSLGLTFQKNDKDFLPLFNVTDSITYTTNILRNLRTKGLDVFGTTAKYFSALRSTFKLSVTYSENEYYNFLNSTDIRNNTGQFMSYEVLCKTAFDGKFNFENNFIINKNVSNSSGNNDIINESIENSAKIIAKINSRFKTFLVGNYYRQNLKLPSDNLFLDYHLWYSFKDRKSEFRLIAMNLLDNQRFTITQISDFSRNEFVTNLIPRNFRVYFSHQF